MEITKQTKQTVIAQQRQQYLAQQYSLELELRVYKKTEQKDRLESVNKRLADIEAALDVLKEEEQNLIKEK